MRSSVKQLAWGALLVLILAVMAAALVAAAGFYEFAADVPHSRPVSSLIDFARQRSVAYHAKDITVPDLGDAGRIRKGAGNYDAMCAQCHLSPAVRATELGKGLYPAPPDLTKAAIQPGPAFWVVKHGIKASGMPAWGMHMPDEEIWNLVAFLQELPKLSAQRYRELVAQSEGHSHGATGTGTGTGGASEPARPREAKPEPKPKAPKDNSGHRH